MVESLPKKGQVFDLEIEKTVFGGQGLGRLSGMAVFVDWAVPGDLVEARIVRRTRNFLKARITRVLRPSPLRVIPPCPAFGVCGGCKWQMISYPRQLAFKEQQVAEALEHIGGIKNAPVSAIIPAENIFGYRNKMEFSCSSSRWLPEEGEGGRMEEDFAIGLHVPGTFSKVIDLSACLLQHEDANRILSGVRERLKASGLPAYGQRDHKGFFRFVVLRRSHAAGRVLVNIVTAHEETGKLAEIAGGLMKDFPEVVSVVNNVTARKSGVAVGDYEIPLAGATSITEKIGGFSFVVSANSFFQTNTAQAGRLYEIVSEFAGLSGRERVLDLYCGAGGISIFLSEKAGSVTGLEISEGAVADARQNCAGNRVANCTFIAGDVAEGLSQTDFAPDVVIADPPRAGMHPKVVEKLADIKPARLVYVSCDPATLARDLRMLGENYLVEEVRPIDMFPHTHHIEAVARLVRKPA
jgi:23S rRNA (uracil1939-C5)-methyltransferase